MQPAEIHPADGEHISEAGDDAPEIGVARAVRAVRETSQRVSDPILAERYACHLGSILSMRAAGCLMPPPAAGPHVKSFTRTSPATNPPMCAMYATPPPSLVCAIDPNWLNN